jgi:hypothetical protein
VKDALLAPCGAYCGSCAYFKKERNPHCTGCGTHMGHPFWGDCKLYACAEDHKVGHCGLCGEFPCDLFINQYDPEHGPKSAFTRTGLLVYRKKVGNQKYIAVFKKLEEEQNLTR